MRCSPSGLRWIARLVCGFWLAVTVAADAAPRKIGRIDRFWADWEGFDPEAYVMMKEMGDRFAKLEKAASIARDNGTENELERVLRDQVTDQVVDWATDLNPAVKPVKALGDLAMNGTQRWLDWSFRYQVNQMYTAYKTELKKSGNVRLAADAASRWLDEESESASLGMKEKELSVLRANRGLMIASIIDNHRRSDPSSYEGKDIARDLRAGRPPAPIEPPSRPAIGDQPRPPTVTVRTSTNESAPKTPNPPVPGPVSQPQPVTAAIRQAVLDCMCSCNSTANQSMVGVRYDPAPNGASPDCADASRGACVNQGIGCWRHTPPTGGDCVNRCYSRHNVAPGSVRP